MTWFHHELDDETAFEAKVFQRPSFWGIRDGRISKLFVYRLIDDEWQVVYEYGRGGEVGEIEPGLLEEIISYYPHGSS